MNSFIKITEFLNNYAGERYNPNNQMGMLHGKIADESSKLLGIAVADKMNGFDYISSSHWQHSGYFANYFWIQLKRSQYKEYPFSISINTVNVGGKFRFKVYTEINDNDFNKSDNDTMDKLKSMFRKSVLNVEELEIPFYYEIVTYTFDRIRAYSLEELIKKCANKKVYKITTNIVLDEIIDDVQIVEKICEAFKHLIPCYDAIFGIIEKKEKWIIPCDYGNYDIIQAFNKLDEIDWHITPQTKSMMVGDIVYIYVGKPFSRLMYECEVTKKDIINKEFDDSAFVKSSNIEWSNDYIRLKLVKKMDSLNLSISDLNNNGVNGNIESAYKIDNAIMAYIEKNDETNSDKKINRDEFSNLSKNMSENEIEALLESKDESSCYEYKETISKIRKLNESIIKGVKSLYHGECQLCGIRLGEHFGEEIVEAHHIEYFSKTQNNDSSNIIVLCPNCHSLIHKCNPIYNKKDYCFEFSNGEYLTIKNVGHLKNN